MNVRKPTDYSAMFTALDALMAANPPQMKLYCEIGRLVSSRTEKGAAVAAAEYLQGTYPDTTGFSPRNLRRMRDFYRTYESVPEVMTEAMIIGWTQNVVILEAELTLQEKAWYIRAVRQFGWSKLELARQIASAAHLEESLDLRLDMRYMEEKSGSENVNSGENPPLPQKLQQELIPVSAAHKKTPDEYSGVFSMIAAPFSSHPHINASLVIIQNADVKLVPPGIPVWSLLLDVRPDSIQFVLPDPIDGIERRRPFGGGKLLNLFLDHTITSEKKAGKKRARMLK